MSPRAAWRLERLGFDAVYDYTAGKADWLAAGLPTEGKPHPPRVLDAADREPLTCAPDEPIAAVADRLRSRDLSVCVVVTRDRIVLGRVRLEQIEPRVEGTAEELMEPGPTTVRADADLAKTLDRMNIRRTRSLLVTTPDGLLLGELRRDDLADLNRP